MITGIRRFSWLSVITLVVLAAPGSASGPAGATSADSSGGQLAFTANLDPRASGELYASVAGGQLGDISNNPYEDWGLAVSPRGGLIAFWSARGGDPQVYLARVDGSNARAVDGTVESSQTGGGTLSWSPDGSALLVPKVIAISPVSVREDVLVVDVAHARARPWLGKCESPFVWSPDGSRVACSRSRSGPVVVFDASGRRRFTLAGTQGLWSASDLLTVIGTRNVVDENDRLVARIRGETLAWAPTGSRLAYARGPTLFVVDLATARTPRVVGRDFLAGTPPAVGAVSFSPDGRSLRYTSATSTFVTSLSTGRTHTLPFYGVWSSDGAHFATIRDPGHYTTGAMATVVIGDRFGRHARVVGRLPIDGWGQENLVWEPDSERLLVEWRYSDVGAHLWLAPVEGGTPTPITTSPRSDAGANWSPDGARVAYSSSPLGGKLCSGCPSTVWVAALDGSPPVQVTQPRGTAAEGSFDSPVGWSADGNRIIYSHAGFDASPPRPEIDIVDAAAGATSVLIAHGTDAQVAPNRSLLAYLDQAGIEVVKLTGGPPQLLVPNQLGVYALAWSPDGASTAYTTGHGIDAVDVDTAAIRHLAPPPSGDTPGGSAIISSLVWSPDGTTIAFTGTNGLYTAPIDQSHPPTLIYENTSDGAPAFSPDGRWIAFVSNAMVVITRPDGSDVHHLTSTAYQSASPAWRP